MIRDRLTAGDPSFLHQFTIAEQDSVLEQLRTTAEYKFVEHDVRQEFGIGVGNNMTTNFPTVMNPTDLATALASSQVQETTGLAGFSFLKMDFENGEWLLGQDSDDVTNYELLVNTPSIQHGWILWSGGRPNKTFVSFTQPLPQPMEAIGDDYPSEARSFQGALIDDGEPLAFDTNSYGGRKGIDVLLGKIKAHAAKGSKHLFPKVKLTSESYANKKRGGKLTYNPVFEIVAWCDNDGNEEGKAPAQVAAPSEEVAEAPEEPKKRQRRKRQNAA